MKLPVWLQNLLIGVLLPLAKTMGKDALVAWANKLKADDPNRYRTYLIVLYRVLVVEIKPIADRSDNDWDNEAVDLVISAIQKSATDNGVILPDVTIHAVALPPVSPAVP